MIWTFSCPFLGAIDTVVLTVLQPVREGLVMEHRVGSGHWFGAGLSPQVSMLLLDYAFEMADFIKLCCDLWSVLWFYLTTEP